MFQTYSDIIGTIGVVICLGLFVYVGLKQLSKEVKILNDMNAEFDNIKTSDEWFAAKMRLEQYYRDTYKKKYVEHQLTGTKSARLLNKAEELLKNKNQ